MLGTPLPARYALFDHHEPGGHRFADFHNELAAGAEWAWLRPVDSTCSLLVDLFMDGRVAITTEMAVALAAGIMTDTLWLQQANAGTLRRLATVLEAADLYVEDIRAVVDSPSRRAKRRPALMAALRATQVHERDGVSILATTADSHDDAFAVLEAFKQLGGDIRIVAFPRDTKAMVMAEIGGPLVEKLGLDLGGLMPAVARQTGAEELWGTRALGRIIAPTSPEALLAASVSVIAAAL